MEGVKRKTERQTITKSRKRNIHGIRALAIRDLCPDPPQHLGSIQVRDVVLARERAGCRLSDVVTVVVRGVELAVVVIYFVARFVGGEALRYFVRGGRAVLERGETG